MEVFEKEQQIENLWNGYEVWKMSESIMEKIRLYSRVATEILAYEEYIERERQAQVQLEAAGLLWRIQDSVQAGDAFVAWFGAPTTKTQTI